MIKQKIWIGNNIGAEGCKVIGEMLKENSTLVKVNLMGDEKERDEEIDYAQNQIEKHFMRKATG